MARHQNVCTLSIIIVNVNLFSFNQKVVSNKAFSCIKKLEFTIANLFFFIRKLNLIAHVRKLGYHGFQVITMANYSKPRKHKKTCKTLRTQKGNGYEAWKGSLLLAFVLFWGVHGAQNLTKYNRWLRLFMQLTNKNISST